MKTCTQSIHDTKLTADDWSEVGDLIDQCIYAADVDASYSRHVRDKAISMLVRLRNKAVDNGLPKRKTQ